MASIIAITMPKRMRGKYANPLEPEEEIIKLDFRSTQTQSDLDNFYLRGKTKKKLFRCIFEEYKLTKYRHIYNGQGDDPNLNFPWVFLENVEVKIPKYAEEIKKFDIIIASISTMVKENFENLQLKIHNLMTEENSQ